MLIGHQKQWQYLQWLVRKDILPHALLFSGENQLGKKTIAFELAKLLLCEQRNKDGLCQNCRTCRDIMLGRHPDCILVEAKDKKEISIAQIRELERFLALHPLTGRYKIGIIDEAHMMGHEAQHAFLKTLEEPRGKTIVILISSKPFLLLSTIRSRTQQIKFFPVPNEELEKGLRESNQDEEKLVNIINLSWGRPGRAITLVNSNELFRKTISEVKYIISLTTASLQERFALAEKVAQNKVSSISNILEEWTHIFRSLWLKKNCPSHFITFLKNIQKTNFLILRTNTNPRLVFEILLMDLPQL